MAVLVLVALIAGICIVNQRSGHDWGDDFALYLRQSRALVEGNVGEVLATNRYMVQESSGSGFSPYSYPWGAPLLLSPVVAAWGIDYPRLKLLETLFFAGFLLLFFDLVARRIGRIGGLALVALIGLNVIYVGWTDNVLAEFPYLLFVVWTLWWVDRVRERRAWDSGPLAPLVGLGLLIGFTYSIRREGVVLFLGLAAAQAAFLWRRRRSAEAISPPPWRRLAIPHGSALAFITGLQLVLPTVILPRYEGGGLHRIVENVGWFRDVLAEQIGLKAPGVTTWDYFGSHPAALGLFVVFVGFAGFGLMVRIVNHFEEDAALIVYSAGVAFIFGTLPFHEGRYLFSLTPLLAYFAFQGVRSLLAAVLDVERSSSKRVRAAPAAVAAGFIVVFMLGNVPDLYHRTEYRLEYDWTHWGPEDPAATEMFEAVRSRTRRDDVLSFFRARAMALYTERTTLQLTNIEHILARADWYVMETESTYVQVLLTAEEAAARGLVIEWENDRFVIWEVPDR